MSSDLVAYTPPSDPHHVDSWVLVLAQVGDLAQKIAGTDFVPEAMRGKPAAVAAAILTGRELGIPPMTALAHIQVIRGKPTQSAQLMRQLILGAGHEIRFTETTNTRCTVEGRRRGTENWEQFRFTADQAKTAKIDLGNYPEDKLVARATSRMARRMFADVLGGVPYLPEEAAEASFESNVVAEQQTVVDAAPEPARRTVRRQQPAAATPAPEPAPTPQKSPRKHAEPPPPVTFDEPPLDDAIDAEIVAEEPAPATATEPAMVTAGQLRAMGAAFTACSWTDRADRLRATSAIVRRDVDSSKSLTRDEAGVLLDTLAWCQEQTDPPQALTDLIVSVESGAEDDAS